MSCKTSRKPLAVLIGAGPGDPQLLTLAGQYWLSLADVVIYDRLANPSLLDIAPGHCRRIYVGKSPGKHSSTQDEINRLLVEACRKNRLVVRLKGGDPFVFGRGGEEIDALIEAGIDFRIVPGVTAAIAAGAYAGISLTDRRAASTVAFVTGHEDDDKARSSIDWRALAGIDTLAFYMGVGNLEMIVERLTEAGKAADTPAAIVASATLPQQKTVVATLGTLAEAAREAAVRPPAIVLVGQVATMHQRMGWFERLGLAGQRVLVTRTRQQSSRLAALLRLQGAAVIECPTIEIAPPADKAAMTKAIASLAGYDWLVLTSPNAASAVMEALDAAGKDARALAGLKIAVIGPATGDVLAARFIKSDLVASTHTAAGLADALTAEIARQGKLADARVLLPRSDIAEPTLPEALHKAGAGVTEVVAYRTLCPEGLDPSAQEALAAGEVDWITFTSSSTVDNFLALCGGRFDLSKVKLAAIGPVTAEALGRHGLPATVVAGASSAEGGMIDSLVDEMAAWPKDSR